MTRIFKMILLAILVIGLAIPSRQTVTAQNENWEIRINQLSTLEGPDAMVLKAYFNIYDDRTGTPMLTVDAENAQVTLLNTNYTSSGVLKKPDVPIYITLVMDSSGSMGGAAQDLREAAKLALNNTPDDSLFSIVQFDQEIKLLQDFTENIPALSFAIDRYAVSPGKGTCLYDATFSAVEAMAKAPAGRRAVILFTDGKDENPDGKPCSKRTYQELVDLAMTSQVPISTIGLSYKEGAINSLELESMAASTGGVAAVSQQDDLGAAFEKIMQALKAQWMVEAAIYPRRGNNDAVLNITLKDGTSLNTAFTINSNTDYPGPPSPVNLKFSGLLLNAAEQSYEIQLDMTSPDLAKYVKVEVWDQDAGSKVGEYTFEQLAENNRFFIPTELLTIGRQYELRISVISAADGTAFEIIRDDQGNPATQLVHEFNFDPSSSYPTLQVQSLVEESGDLLLTVNVTNPDLIGGFDGWLVDESTNTQVPNSTFTAPAINGTTGVITIPTKSNRVPNGEYTIIVRVLAKNNNVYSTATYEGVTYTAPSIFERLGVALIAAPIFLVGIFGILVLVVVFLMWNSSRQKSLSGTPVLQGRLGGKLGGGKQAAGPVIPVAQDEPIPSRSPAPRPAPPPPASAPVASRPVAPAPPPSRPPAHPAGDATMIAGAPVAPRAFLSVVQSAGPASQNPTPVAPLPFVIGRTEGSMIIQEPNISRRHAQVTYDAAQGKFFITDLNSSNGTRLNQQRLTPNQPAALQHGAQIGLGPNVTLRFDII